MAINAVTENEFMQQLYHKRKLSLNEVVDIFYASDKPTNFKSLATLLRGRMGDGTDGEVSILDRQTRSLVEYLEDDTLTESDRFDVLYNQCRSAESSVQSMDGAQLEIEDFGGDEPFAGIKEIASIRVCGSTEDALPSIKRLKEFTHYIGILMIKRDFETLSAHFYDTEQFSSTHLKTLFESIVKKYGEPETFYSVQVSCIYAGDDRGKKYFDEMRLPDGITRNELVGSSRFMLSSSVTPNGIARWGLDVIIDVIEREDGVFRITRLDTQYTY
ncbi:hypothetical protein [Pleionea litopenaei]|uniref:Uncharacterized protein n=1 Tax=Pleionea litopenaei TaxID=3070815 RepID=A0AA51RSJ6_9GAMM|nr:hypothetical protein [Pleionea sp. HL-JVS1]WMS86805.1 hypothetical protein Q9312_16415 [Pleionea sp. HL-JVS1]